MDNGRGIPVGWNEKAQMDSLTLVFTQLHAGGKFNHDVYKTSSGLNGIGQKAIAALSTHLQVWSNNSKDNWFYTQTFEKGIIKSDVTRCRLPEEYKGLIKKKGTIVQWTPDPTIFTDSTDLDLHRLKRELKDIQYLCPGLHIFLKIDNNEEIEYYSEKGLEELVAKNENDSIFTYNDEFTDVAVNFAKEDGYTFRSFVNVCYTNLGGTHLNGLKKAICNVVKDNSKKKILNDDILEGVIGAIHHRMADPQYQGQTKNELTNTPVEKEIIEKLTPALEKYFRRNKDVLTRIVTYAEKMFEQKEKMKASKDLLKGLKTLNAGSKYISDKFLDADRRKYKNPSELEMFIVEGDSAGGHFKHAREGFQGELKIRGKIINAAKATPEELFGKPTKKGEAKCEGNREIKDLVAALGCGIQEDYDESKLRFGKIVMLCFSGDTKVKMLDGTNKTFEELVEYEKEHPNSDYWVYSVNENGEFVPGKAKLPRITGYTKELIELTLDNGAKIKCTPDHMFMLRDGTYKAAKDLENTDSLMPLYTKYEDGSFCKDQRKIVSKQIIKYETEIPVYDLTVDTYHNFLLADAEVIVHNCDSDTDGGHITNLITAFFVNYMPDLIKNGHLYIIDAPLFVATGAKTKAYGMTRKEIDNKMKELKCSDYTITRLKGWGECSPEQLSELCLNPKTRKLIQVNWTDATEKACEDTMGEGTAFRKELLGIDK